MMQELKAFLLRGNVVDLAVAVVIGAAFTAIVTTLVEGILTPLIALIFGQPSIYSVVLTVSDTEFLVGAVLAAIINFLLVGLVLFLVVKAINRAEQARRAKSEVVPEAVEEETPEDILLLRQIRDTLATRS